VVTGASSGIGRATAHSLAAYGADIALAARREEKLEEVEEELRSEYSTESIIVPTNVRDESAVKEMIAKAADTFGKIDIVVNVAGLARGGPIDEHPTEDYRTVMETNVDGTFFTTRASIPHLRETEGSLILMGSFAGNYPYDGAPVYGGTRWWIRGFAKSVQGQVGQDGVGVTVINPSEVLTQVWEDEYEEGEILAPEDVGEAIAFIAQQDPPAVVTQLDLYRRDRISEL
jgi:NADP-dependent 3-hydroxy acid dehydrogenase YdfG